MKLIASGYVLSIGKKTFWCRMSVKEPWHDPNIECQIDISKLNTRERPLLQCGAYLSILKGGTIRFSRIEGWTKKEIVVAKKRADKIWKNIWG